MCVLLTRRAKHQVANNVTRTRDAMELIARACFRRGCCSAQAGSQLCAHTATCCRFPASIRVRSGHARAERVLTCARSPAARASEPSWLWLVIDVHALPTRVMCDAGDWRCGSSGHILDIRIVAVVPFMAFSYVCPLFASRF
jgi:hypothetical protein